LLESLLYVSASKLTADSARIEIDRILLRSRSHNEQHGITGGLIYTINYFAQVLEGTRSELDTLMESISADPRHEQVRVIVRKQVRQRAFRRWAIAYSGPSFFIDRQVKHLLCSAELPDPNLRNAAEKLTALTRQFVDA
jgi:hypothetical protein